MSTGLLRPVSAGTPVEDLVDDRAWLQAMLDAEAALARAQARLGRLPAQAAAVITRAARAELFDQRALALAARETANPIVGLVAALTARVAEVDPPSAEYVHRGSTSQDILDTGAMLVAARVLRLIRGDLARTADGLAGLAAAYRDTPVAGRTLALQAVPTTFGLKAAGWRRLVLDADVRLARLLDGGLPVSLGGAAGTLAGYLEYARLDGGPAEPEYADDLATAFADETGLAIPALPWHTLRTPIADLGAALAFTAGALGKFAVDVLTLARTEIGEVVEPAGGGSSAMPHKRNPVLATLVRSAALQVPVLATGLTQALLGEDERSAGGWQAEWPLLREALRLTGGAAHTAAALAEGLEPRPDRMLENLARTGGQVVSERLAAVLTPALGKTEARRLLSRAAAEADRRGLPLAEVLADEPATKALDLDDLCDPSRYTGAAGHLVDGALLDGPAARHGP
ncbi:3-carboxy-cis,cis-muconate cycloisomerase [Dactylosporangium sp. NPDC000555]|uniref:3-carboxy-cis,cis-muconate cycloisomerase n=1 Tax=Dactylosporangium sp. NPDC000555 TaxID=3154260 RepID=UPI00332F21C3